MHYFWKLNKYVILYYQKLYKYLKTIYCLCVLYSAANFTIRLVIHQQIFYMKLLGTLCTKILTLHIKSGWANGAMCYVANVCTEKNVLITYLCFYLAIIRKKFFFSFFSSLFRKQLYCHYNVWVWFFFWLDPYATCWIGVL